MSALVFWLTEESIVIGTDTRVSRPTDFQPLKYTTKAFAVPHLRLVIAGTGLLEAIMQWYAWVLLRSKATNIEELDKEAELFMAELKSTWKLEGHMTATIYHFGVGSNGKCKGYAYRSTNNFKSEILNHGLAIKPAYPEIFELIESKTFENVQSQFSFIIREQRCRDDAEENNKKVGIGGEMILTTLTPEGLIASFCFDKFEDYEEMKNRFDDTDYGGNS